MDFHSIKLLFDNSNKTILIDNNNNYLHISYKNILYKKINMDVNYIMEQYLLNLIL